MHLLDDPSILIQRLYKHSVSPDATIANADCVEWQSSLCVDGLDCTLEGIYTVLAYVHKVKHAT